MREATAALMRMEMDIVCSISNCPQLNNPCNGYELNAGSPSDLGATPDPAPYSTPPFACVLVRLSSCPLAFFGLFFGCGSRFALPKAPEERRSADKALPFPPERRSSTGRAPGLRLSHFSDAKQPRFPEMFLLVVPLARDDVGLPKYPTIRPGSGRVDNGQPSNILEKD